MSTRVPPYRRSVITTGAAVALTLGCIARINQPAKPDGGAAVDAGANATSNDALATGELACDSRIQGNAGCSFFAAEPVVQENAACYAMVVVNPGTKPARLQLVRGTRTFAMEAVAHLPRGSGANLTYQRFDAAAGLAPGDVAIIFLAGRATGLGAGGTNSGCPIGTASAVDFPTNTSVFSDTGQAFHLTSDRPVVAYDVNPFGGVFSYVTSSTLLLPAEAWARSYIAATPIHPGGPSAGNDDGTFILIVASQDDTEVSLRAPVATMGGIGVPAAEPGQVARLRLNAGQFAQVMERPRIKETGFSPGMSGTVVAASKPVGLIGGVPCFNVPTDTVACDAAHQQIPPVSAWGSEYAAVRQRSRLRAGEEPTPWQLVAAVDGTMLTYAPRIPTPYPGFPAAAPTTLAAGQSVQFWTAEPFVVRSQDAAHPFYLAGLMTGGAFLENERTPEEKEAGDPEFVNVVPAGQYVNDYTFFTDPTYSETTLVVIRKPGADNRFADVKLGCAASAITGWSDLGGAFQYARVDLVTGDYHPVIPGCDNGAHRITSSAPFGVTVWGWSTTLIDKDGGGYTSYAYPAGAALAPINDVIVIP